MKKHVKVYMDYFGYDESDFIPSELSGENAVDIHHVSHGRRKKDNSIENLIALTRREHDRAHFKTEPFLHPEQLKEFHRAFMKLGKGNRL